MPKVGRTADKMPNWATPTDHQSAIETESFFSFESSCFDSVARKLDRSWERSQPSSGIDLGPSGFDWEVMAMKLDYQ